jgi:ABC-type transport system involved in cytochrome c biogenesis permease component
MTGFLQHLIVNLRLYFRNRMALLYGYLFPTIFLVAFGVLYRYERVPLVRHMGEVLTVAVLGGACFGLPTTMVGERERGVWRRYRVTPVGAAALVASTVAARYLLLLTAGLLQVALALAIGMPLPRHPLELVVAFSLVSFAFLGLGLVIAMLADNVPAVQALGQCIFLPMLIIGGVAVPLAALPDWAQHASAFFPGRYAVQTIQACVAGDGLRTVAFSLTALTLIGIAGVISGSRMFRWDAQQRFSELRGRGWIALALAAWVGVGIAAESRGQIATRARTTAGAAESGRTSRIESPTPSAAESAVSGRASSAKLPGSKPDSARARGAAPSPATPAWPPASPAGPRSWQAVTIEDIDRDLLFDHLPPDSGIISPIAGVADAPDPEVEAAIERLRQALPAWPPGSVADPVQRTRNYLYVLSVPDVFQRPLERFAPQVIFERLQQQIPKDDLIKILYWIAMHPEEGDDSAIDELQPLGIRDVPEDTEQIRERVALYGVKLLGRLLGRIPWSG